MTPVRDRPPRVVIDTSVLVAAAYAERSSARRLMDAVGRGEVVPLVSPATFREHRHIVSRAVRRPGGVGRVLGWLRRAEAVFTRGDEAAGAIPEDPSDGAFLAAAVVGGADFVVSLDRHLLDVRVFRGVPVVRPGGVGHSAPSRRGQ